MTGPDHRKLAGRVCVITGATSGIGFATARLLAEHGARLVLLGRDKEKLARTTGEIPGAPIGVLGDVTDLGDLRRLMQTTADAYGGIDVLMANAGIGRFARSTRSRRPSSTRCAPSTSGAPSSPSRRRCRTCVTVPRSS